MKLLRQLSWAVIALAVAQVLVGLAMSFIGNPEGWVGAILYAVQFGLPLLLIWVALRSGRPGWRAAAGWVGLVLAAFYTLVVIANWSGYSNWQAVFAVGVTTPTVLVDLVVFWAAVIRGRQLAGT